MNLPRRGENIRKRKDGRWEARYKKGVDDQGNTIYGSVYAKTYREAKEKQQLRYQQLQLSERSISSEMKLADALEMWLGDNRIRLKDSTQYRYRYLSQIHILPELGETQIGKLTSDAVNAFLIRKLESGRKDGSGGLSPAYVRSMGVLIGSVLSYAAARGWCSPMVGNIHQPPNAATGMRILSENEQKILTDHCFRNDDVTTLGILLSMFAGLRIGEICALSWDDVDLKNRIIHVRHTVSRTGKGNPLVIDSPKTRSSLRDIPICSGLMPVLERQYQCRISDYLISDKPGFTDPRTYEYRYHKVLRQCGIPPTNYHALRHTFATRCVGSGVDIKSLSEILGHANASTTLNIYVHSSMERKRTQLEKILAP